MAECNHPHIEVIGNVDPVPDFGTNRGAWNRIKLDARCKHCDESLWVLYDKREIREP